MNAVVTRFNENFESWDIVLPLEHVTDRSRGKIREAGWNIQFLFGSDEQGEFLDYYAAHRMTNDRHVCIRADGSVEGLPALFFDMRLSSSNPEEDARLKAEHQANNEEIASMLREKGFA